MPIQAVGFGKARRRRRRGTHWRARLWQMLAPILLGCQLVGCSQPGKRALDLVGWKKAQPPLIVLKTSKIADERIAAMRQLARPNKLEALDRQLAVDLLAFGLKEEKNELARAAAATSLGSYAEPRAVAALEHALTDRSDMVRGDVCRSLGKVGTPESFALLAKLAQTDGSVDVRLAATDALARRHEASVAPYLVAQLRDKDVAVARLARNGLKKTFDIDLGNDHGAWLTYIRDHSTSPATQVASPEAPADKKVR